MPPNLKSHDYRAYQNKIGEGIGAAIRDSGVKYVVNLSSLGADLPEGTGPIKGLSDQEQKLNKLERVNVPHLRPTFYMGNLLRNIGMIISKSIMGASGRT